MKRLAVILVLASCVALAACSTTLDDLRNPKEKVVDESKCPDLQKAKNVSAVGDAIIITQYDDTETGEDTDVMFDEGYWDIFWQSHFNCKICLENGDVPEKHIKK